MSSHYSFSQRGPQAALHDCGKHGRLTVAQIAGIAGVSANSIYCRIRMGVAGEKLCESRTARKSQGRKVSYRGQDIHTVGSVNIAVAVTIARAYTTRPPSIDQLRNRFQMSRATAYRWRAAFVDAMGIVE